MFFIRKILKEDIDIYKVEIDTIEIKVLDKYSDYTLEELQKDKDRTYTIIGKEAISEHVTDEEKTVIDMFKQYKDYDNASIDILDKYIIEKHGLQDTSITKQVIKQKLRDILASYISFDLFGEKFNPEEDGNFNIFGMNTINLKEFIGNVFASQIKNYLLNDSKAQYEKINFSIVDSFQVKIDSSLELKKTIYTRTPYPSSSGGLEKSFMEKMDKDGFVESFVKIMEYKHNFAIIKYRNKNGMISHYHPDFMVKTKDSIYLVETKANKDMTEDTVLKKKEATKNYINEINKLDKKYRGNRKWHYVILSEDNVNKIDNFNGMVRQANIKE